MFQIKLSFLFILAFTPNLVKSDPSKIVDNFHSFSTTLQQTFSQSTEASETRPGIHLFNPFGVGYTLANLNEQLWHNISTSGIPDALRTLQKYVSEDYAHLLGLFKKSKFKITSTIYSRYGNVTKDKSPTLSKLLSHLITLDFVKKPAEFVDSFSSILDMATKGHLDNELLPKGLWQKVFDNQTQGAYVNTMYYKVKHSQPWTYVGERTFNFDTIVKFLEVEGDFRVFRNDNVTAVVVDIQQAPFQQMIFAKSHSYITVTEMKEEIRQSLKTFADWPITKMRVQIPALNVTNLSRHNLGMILMGVNETFCNINGTETNGFVEPDFVQQPITQANHFEFAPGYIEFSTATGSIVNLNTGESDTDFDEDYEEDDLATIISEDDADDYRLRSELATTSALQFQRAQRRYQKAVDQILSKEEGKCEIPSEFGQSHSTQKSSRVVEDLLVFDTPFTWILRDGVLGETFSGSVTSLCQYNKVLHTSQSSPAHGWLQDVFKVAFWKCF